MATKKTKTDIIVEKYGAGDRAEADHENEPAAAEEHQKLKKHLESAKHMNDEKKKKREAITFRMAQMRAKREGKAMQESEENKDPKVAGPN